MILLPEPKITIAELRARHGKLTQKEFGDSVGVSPQTVNAWEKDIMTIKSRHLLKICQVYGVKSSELLGV